MRSGAFKAICRFLVASLMLMSLTSARAGMIGVDQLSAASSGAADRIAVMDVLNRSDVASQLQAQGVDPQAAMDRFAAMSDPEVSALRGQLDSLPAGASSNAWVWGGVVVVAILVWWLWFK
jgi:Family of unknown function (DUF6627)